MTTLRVTAGGRLHARAGRYAAAVVTVLLAACASGPPVAPGDGVRAPAPAAPPVAVTTSPRPGGYYLDDGPGDNPPANLDQLPDAVPRVEPYHRFANRPYVVFGRTYQPDISDRPFRQRGVGSWYGRKFHGQRTSSGEIYDMYAMTAAHPTLPIPSYVRVANVTNGRSVIVRVNDRGPFLHDRVIDLSFAAAHRLDYARAGSALLEVERLLPEDILAGRIPSTTLAANRTAVPVASAAVPGSSTAHPAANSRAVVAAAPEESGVLVNVVATPDLIVATPLPAAPTEAAVASGVPSAATGATSPARPVPAGAAAGVAASVGSATAAPLTGGFALQLGAFRTAAAAEAFRDRIVARLASLADRLQVVPGGDVHRVQVGPYRERREAEQAAAALRGVFDVNPVIVPRR